ncbi:MAG: hypothetical protein ACLGP3_01805, partial [Acidobacteriota bacterium]
FPGGHTLKKFELPTGWLASTAGGDRLLFGPLTQNSSALLDPATEQLDREFREEMADVRGDEWAAEIPEGGLGVEESSGNFQQIPLPITPLTAIEANAFSPNGRYLSIANRARGGEWDLSTGKRMAVTSPFRAVAVDDAGNLEAAFVAHELNPSSDPSIDRLTHKYVPGLTSLFDPVQFGTIRIRLKPLNPQQALDNNVRLDAYDARTEARLWSRTFWGPLPKMVEADGDQTLFIIGRRNWTGDAKLKHTSDLPFQFINPLGNVVEVISNRTGKPEHALFTPQLPVADRQKDERTAELFGSLLAVYGNNNDTTVYRVSDGVRLFAFFGRALAGDDTLGMVAATNRIQELNLYDAASGKRLAHYLLDQAVIAARFVPARKQLLVLTASQRVYRIDLSRLSAGGSPAVPQASKS